MSKTSDLGLLFLHALPLDGSMWANQMDILPGHSHAPTLYPFGATLTDWAVKALALVEEQRLIVVGCSVGGSCALEVAQLAPDRVAALVLIGTKPKHRPEPALRDEAFALIANEGLYATWDKYWAPLFSEDTDTSTVQSARDIMLSLSEDDISSGVSVFHSRESRDRFAAKSDIPITVVTGEHDVAPGVAVSRELATAARFGTLHVIPHCGHYVSLEQPQRLREILSEVVAIHA
ncbi:MAG: alpha/beta hydrolase [Rhodobiaceae bacterium]|nr:alpha/beta hydrolase [Rhodobiaceae bacterium]